MMRMAERKSVLAYHEIMPESNYAYCVTTSAFADHLQLIDLLAQGNGNESGPRAQITFDDGEQSQLHNALPLLAEHKISAMYFVSPGLIGTEAKFLGWSQLRELQAAGHSVQSHGWSHKFLTSCNDAELAHELSASRLALQEKLGNCVEEISIPGGRWNNRVIAACANAGYMRVYVSEPWMANEIHGVQIIGRFMVRRTTTMAELTRMIQQDRSVLWMLKTRSQIRRGLVSLVGDDFYHRLWCRLTGYNDFDAARRQEFTPEGQGK